ncbi:hypothetical protein FGG08_002109 [Glutinoglossum americanum]|uniref:MOSC domain-containing protein n=1 Tax=Glutinoglossum americanum TaxID=1670608 RepID=A0A9P8I5G1_9PEZI|nr:hypothetical protein FGG08_002109 [Glutinoglossum americanum]
MKVSQIYIYPIKSLRGVSLSQAQLTSHGFEYDRTFMLLRVDDAETGQFTNLQVGRVPQLTLFTTEIQFPTAESAGEIFVHYRAPSESQASQRSLGIPLQPTTEGLAEVKVTLYQSAAMAYNMGAKYNDWFSGCLGYEAILVYLGSNLRPVLGNLSPNVSSTAEGKSSGWLSTITNSLQLPGMAKQEGVYITFADEAHFLVVTEASLDDVSSRLPGDEKMDVTKFRPNIVLSDSPIPWDEDFWGELTVSINDGNKVQVPLTQNCARCQSINVDYATGELGAGESGSVLKKLMKDRRVDAGTKYSPIFGRYGFVGKGGAGRKVTVGDEATVTKRNKERTKLGTYL